MNQILKPDSRIKVFYILFASILMIINVSMAQATTLSYNVTGVFHEPQTQPRDTIFNGSFDWDGSVVSNLHGSMNSSMYETDNINPIPNFSFPLMELNYQLSQSIVGDMVTATVFLKNTTDVFSGGGYVTGDALRYGNSPAFGLPADGNSPNDNAYFSFAFDKTSMAGILDEMVYADCTAGGMMGQFCMTGFGGVLDGTASHPMGAGSMGAYASSLTISAVPVPAAAWLFGTALAGLVGISRKRV